MALSPEQTLLVAAWASRLDAIDAVWLFGSRARGDHSSESDYDIALELASKQDKTDKPFTAYFFEYGVWKEEIRSLLQAEVSLVCYRDDLPCKFDPRVEKIWSRTGSDI